MKWCMFECNLAANKSGTVALFWKFVNTLQCILFTCNLGNIKKLVDLLRGKKNEGNWTLWFDLKIYTLQQPSLILSKGFLKTARKLFSRFSTSYLWVFEKSTLYKMSITNLNSPCVMKTHNTNIVVNVLIGLLEISVRYKALY